jgi:glycosyltransferase involved in cell wall biosynthesis
LQFAPNFGEKLRLHLIEGFQEGHMSSHSLNARPGPDRATTVCRPVRLAYLVSHPIQYQAPLLRRIAADPGIDLTVFYGSDFSVKGYRDHGFGVDVQWDVPLLDGYKYEFLPPLRDNGTAGIFSPISVGLTRRLAGEGTGSGFDVLWVHGYSTVNQMHGILAAKAVGIPVLVRSDSSLTDRPRGRLKLLLKRVFFAVLRGLVDGVLVSGTKNLEYWRYYMGPDFPMFLLPYAVDNHWFQQQSRLAAATRPELQAELNLDPKRPVILFASKLQTRKHCNDLIAAYEKLSPGGGIEPEPYLLIVGDGEERVALERQAAATGFNSIRFCGFRNQSELPRFLDLCSVFVLPSRHEPWGLIVNEAMNAGRAVIVTDDVGCQEDLVTDGVEGCVYPVRDVEALATALRRVLSSPETAAAMGQRALERIDKWSFTEDVANLGVALAHVTERPVPSGVISQASNADVLPNRRPLGGHT